MAKFKSSNAVKYSMPLRLVIPLLWTLIAVTELISASLSVPSELVSKLELTYSRKAESGKVEELIVTEANALEHTSRRQSISDRR